MPTKPKTSKPKSPKVSEKSVEKVSEQHTTKIYKEKDFLNTCRIFANYKTMAYSPEYGNHEVNAPTTYAMALSKASTFLQFWGKGPDQEALIIAVNWRATGLVAEIGVKLIFQCNRFSIEPVFVTTKYNEDVIGILVTKKGVSL